MRSLFIVFISIFFLFAAKEKPGLKANADYFGTYYRLDSPGVKAWVLKPMPKAENKIAFYHNGDTSSVFFVVMKDSTHFKSPGEFAQETPGQGTRFWSAKGEFLPGGRMQIAVHNSDVSSALKVSFSMEGDEKVLYIKK